MSDIEVTIYRVAPVIQTYARTPSGEFKALHARYTRLIATKRFRDAFPRYGEVALLPGSGGGSYAHFGGHSQGRVITLGQGRSEAILLHEIAHHVAQRHSAYGFCADHGTGFALALLHVVKVAQGAEAERALRHAYASLRIRVYKAGGRRGVLPRVAGAAPERAQKAISKMIAARDAAVAERAALRAMLRSAPDQVGKHPASCAVCGDPGAVLSVTYWTRRQGGGTYEVYAECEACGLSEWMRHSSREWAAMRG